MFNFRTFKFYFFLLLIIFTQSSTKAADEDWPISVQQLSLGYIATSENPTPLMIFSNSSFLNSAKNWSLASTYARPYGMKELEIIGVGFAKRWRKFVLGVGISQFGFELYKEQKLSIGFSRELTQNFNLGFSIRYQQIEIKNYGQTGAFTFDIGWQYSINIQTKITGAIQNIHRGTIGIEKQPLPQILRMGLEFKPLDQINTFVEIYKDLSYDPEARFGIDVRATESLFLRFGFTKNPSRFTGGFAMNMFGFNLDYGFSHHQVLGYTHAVGLVISR